MKKIFSIQNILILFLVGVAVVEFVNPKGFMPRRTFTIHDTVGVPVHDTVGVEVPVEVEVQVEVEKPVPYAVHDTISVDKPIDTMAILNALGQKIIKKDILKLPNNIGTVTIFDTISNSKIIGRSFKSDVKQKVVRDTVFTPLPRVSEFYFGVDAKFDKPNVVNLMGVSFLLKDKDNKHLYKLGVGVTNRIDDQGTNGSLTPYIGGGVYWRVRTKRN